MSDTHPDVTGADPDAFYAPPDAPGQPSGCWVQVGFTGAEAAAIRGQLLAEGSVPGWLHDLAVSAVQRTGASLPAHPSGNPDGCWLCRGLGGIAIHVQWTEQRGNGKPLWTAHEYPSDDPHPVEPCPVCVDATEVRAVTDFAGAQDRAWANKLAKGFNTTDVPMEFCLLMEEVGEAFSAWRKGSPGYRGELADAAIFLLGLAQMTGVDLGAEVAVKLAENEARAYVRLPNGTPVKAEAGQVPAGAAEARLAALCAAMPPSRFRDLADWFDTDDEFKSEMFPEQWPPGSRSSEQQDDLRRFADLLETGDSHDRS